MKKIFAILATAVLMLTILTLSVSAERGVPGIEVTKTVWDDESQTLEDKVRAVVGETLEFHSTIHNSGSCNLTEITVWDILSDSLDYVGVEGDTPEPDGVVYNPDGTTTLTWFLPGPLAPSNKRTFLIYATVTKCGVDTNTQYAEAEGCGQEVSDDDTATVNVPGDPNIGVSKKVWDQEGTEWERSTTANLGDDVQFNLTVRNDGTCDDCDLTNINVTDTLSDSLEYTSADPEPDTVTHNADGTTTLKWFLPDPLETGETETLLIDAKVIECGVDTNTINATAECCGDIVSGEDTATVNVQEVPGINVTKTVWDGTAWVDEITANLNDIVEFKLTVHNNGTCCGNLTDITVLDILSDSFEYIIKGDTPGPDKVDYTKQGGTVLEWYYSGPLEPCETMTYLITARVIKCGESGNYAEADAKTECIPDWVEDDDIATVKVPGVPGIEVNKTVFDPETVEWVDKINATIGATVLFKSTIHNSGTCCNLTDITVWDILSDSLEYVDVQGETPEPDGVVKNQDGTTTLTWFLPGPLTPCNTETFLILATVTKCGVDTNTQYAEAYGCGQEVSGDDFATVNVPGVPDIEVTKTVWNGSAWVKEITANLGDIVQFNSTIHNNGTCCYLTSINVTDTFSSSLEYISAEPNPDGVCFDCPPGTGKTVLTWFLQDPLAPSNKKTFIINAKVIDCGVDTNTQNATARQSAAEKQCLMKPLQRCSCQESRA
jgi:fimbrial isopeptide formation D2 family protein/uncharacterized repeat protein (TIGR01451 family)